MLCVNILCNRILASTGWFILLKQIGYYKSPPALTSEDTAFCLHTLFVWFLQQNGSYLLTRINF